MKSTPQDMQMLLPFLPGYNFKGGPGPQNHRKSHPFDYCNGVPVFREERPGIGGTPLPNQKEEKLQTSSDFYPKDSSLGEAVPAWIAFDRQVLRFYAYYQEAVHERREEQYRVRKVNIYYYLEDDSVHVSEPRIANSGMPQGVLICRHRIPLPQAKNRQHYTVANFNVGQEVTFYCRTFLIVGCDDFTRKFLGKLGSWVPPNIDYPADPYTLCRSELMSRMKPTRPNLAPKATLKQFLENDRKVLRFYCIWDDSSSVFGDCRNMILHYFLADDTIEIREQIPPNSGRDNVTNFLRRCRLPKHPKFRPIGGGKERSEDFYTDRDLTIGSVLHLYGRSFVICDCDTFTKEYYYHKFGIENFEPLRFTQPVQIQSTSALPAAAEERALTGPAPAVQSYAPPEQIVPPYNGFGSEEDSLGSCIALIPKPPKKDFKKLMTHDSNAALRFSAVLNTVKQVDADRRFVIHYFLADDTIQVFEPQRRNSGIVGGKFLERQRVKRPDGVEYYSTPDLFVGAELNLHSHEFLLIAADEYTKNYMSSHKGAFPNQAVLDQQQNVGRQRALEQ